MRVIRQKTLEIYVAENGEQPFIDWLESLKDNRDRFRIKERLDRIALGNLGDHKHVGNGVYELRADFGSGYRIYYGNKNEKIVLLLCGGNKSTQKKDIKKAINYWKDYLSE